LVATELGSPHSSPGYDSFMTNQEHLLRTPRLDLVATTLQHIEAELENPASLGLLLGVTVPVGWPPGEYDRNALEFFRDRLRAGGSAHVGWYGWYAITRDSEGRRDSLVAGAGYLGPPAQGSVEVGYSVIPEARGRGYATELVEALVMHAFTHSEVHSVTAHTSDSNISSTQVLLRCGFQRVGPGSEPETVQYRRQKTPSA
jgi:RimJ/RimL family protein N-acetyltransferase